jgi:hypothetical protein
VSGGIYSDPGSDHIACVSESGQMSQTIGQAQKHPEWWMENCLGDRTENCPEWKQLESELEGGGSPDITPPLGIQCPDV